MVIYCDGFHSGCRFTGDAPTHMVKPPSVQSRQVKVASGTNTMGVQKFGARFSV